MALGDIAAKMQVPVFACGEDKKPITKNGFKDAVTDPARIIAMFDRPGAQLIGVPTGPASGLLVIDIDIRADRTGMDWLHANADALPETRTHKTRSGGLHLVFRYPEGVEIRNSASRIAPGVDVRALGGYIIAPPSPGYEVADQSEPADMPIWLIKACLPPPRQPQPVVERAAPRLDGGSRYGIAALNHECDAVRSAPWGQQETTLNSAGLKIGALIAGGELQEGIAVADLISAGRSMASEPGREPWDSQEVADKVRRAVQDGMATPRKAPPPRERHDDRDEGYWSSLEADADQWERLAPDLEAELNEEDARRAENEAQKQKARAQGARSPLDLLWFTDIAPVLDAKDFVQGVLMEQSAAVVYGESNAGKTFWATDLSLHVAAGAPWCGKRVEQGGVIYCALEGGIGFRNRVAAWRAERGLDDTRLPFAAIPCGLNLLDPAADTERLIQAILGAQELIHVPVKLIVIDTLSRALAGGNENAPEDMGALVKNMDRIRAETGACVLFIHHSGKDQAKGARGHSLLRAAIDTEIEVAVEEGRDGKTATVVKQREMKKGDVFDFNLRVVELGANRHGEQVTTCLVDHGEASTGQVGRPPLLKLTGHVKRAFDVLVDLIATSGRTGDKGVPSGCSSVPEKWWRDQFYDRGVPGLETQDAKQKAYKRASLDLVNKRRVAMASGRVWIVSKQEQPVSRDEKNPDINPDKPDINPDIDPETGEILG